MAFPDPSNYGTDPESFSGRDYALGRFFYGDGGGGGSGDGNGCVGCAFVASALIALALVLTVIGNVLFG